MTTTKALEKLHQVLVGSAGKNSVAKNLDSLATNWKLPVVPALESNGTKYYVLKVVKSSSGTTYTWDEKTFT